MRKDEADQTCVEDRIITLQEAAVMFNSSCSTVLRMAVSGELPAFRIRNAWRTSDTAIDAFIEKSMQEQEIFCRSVEV